MVSIPPVLVSMFWIGLEYFDGSLLSTMIELNDVGFARFMNLYAPSISSKAVTMYVSWVLFQAALYTLLPGKGFGQMTPAGYLLQYNTNGLLAWALTTTLTVVGTATGVFDPAVIADNWGGLLVTMNVWGYMLSIIAYVKAHVAPSHPQDRKFSGNSMILCVHHLC